MDKGKNKTLLIFLLSFFAVVVCLALSAVNNNEYNSKKHNDRFTGAGLFSENAEPPKAVSVNAVARSSTWGKIFDFNKLRKSPRF